MFQVMKSEREAAANPAERKLIMSQAPATITPLPPGAVEPIVPTVAPSVSQMHTIRGKWIRRVMFQDEYDLYMDTWSRWIKDHVDEWTTTDDLEDLHVICMETVAIFRVQAMRLQNPLVDTAEEYKRASLSMQRARENLAARRVDRVGTKDSRSGNVTNIAILAGTIPDALQQARQTKMFRRNAETTKFLEDTVAREQSVHAEIIDVPQPAQKTKE